jgi:hypothetical protein
VKHITENIYGYKWKGSSISHNNAASASLQLAYFESYRASTHRLCPELADYTHLLCFGGNLALIFCAFLETHSIAATQVIIHMVGKMTWILKAAVLRLDL